MVNPPPIHTNGPNVPVYWQFGPMTDPFAEQNKARYRNSNFPTYLTNLVVSTFVFISRFKPVRHGEQLVSKYISKINNVNSVYQKGKMFFL